MKVKKERKHYLIRLFLGFSCETVSQATFTAVVTFEVLRHENTWAAFRCRAHTPEIRYAAVVIDFVAPQNRKRYLLFAVESVMPIVVQKGVCVFLLYCSYDVHVGFAFWFRVLFLLSLFASSTQSENKMQSRLFLKESSVGMQLLQTVHGD